MVTTAWGGAHDADIVALLIDAKKGIDEEAEAILGKLAEVRQPKVLVLNKVDLVDKPALLDARADGQRQGEIRRDLHAVGADRRRRRRSEGLARRAFAARARGTIRRTRSPMRRCAASRPRSRARSCSTGCTRNCPIRRRSRPISGRNCATASARIEQTIYVERESQRKIVLGKGGATIKAIGAEARKEIAELTEQKVHLFLFVKVREGWGDDPERYRRWGWSFRRSDRCHGSAVAGCDCDSAAGIPAWSGGRMRASCTAGDRTRRAARSEPAAAADQPVVRRGRDAPDHARRRRSDGGVRLRDVASCRSA